MPTDSRPIDLPQLREQVWEELQQCVGDKAHPWRTPVLATCDGEGADARTVVLRDVNEAARKLVIYTDSRSPKVGQLEQHPMGTLVFWCPTLNWQLRLRCRLQVASEGLAVSSRWAKLKLSASAQDYLSPLAPGTELDHPARPAHGERSHFALLYAEVSELDWLELHPDGHRRAVFGAQGARWLVP